MQKNIKEPINALEKKIADIDAQAKRENRALSTFEANLKNEMQEAIHELRQQPEGTLTVVKNGPLGRQDWGSTWAAGRGYELRSPFQAKDSRSLFGRDGYHWEDKGTNFFQAVFSGRHHPGLITCGMVESVPSDGGFLVPVEYSEKIHAVSLENEIVMPRCFVQPMRTNEIKIPAMAIGSHASSLMGGFTASYVGEGGAITDANPTTRSMELNAKKLTGLIRFSSELAADIPGGSDQIVNICGKGLAWYRDQAFLKGSGVGEPQGILHAPCLVEVAPEAGQHSGIIYDNLTRMMSRMFAGSFKNSVWVAHQSTIPQLLSLSIAVGTGGSFIPVMTESNGEFRILTRPVLFTEKTEPLNTKGDIMLIDFSQYVVGLRQEMRFDVSIHVHFNTDELLARLIERHDGQTLWNQALTLADGVTTVSPFVVLGARS